MNIRYKAKRTVNWKAIKNGSLFLTESGVLCIKLPKAQDDHGETNCYCFDDNKYYFYKDHQKAGEVAAMEVII